MKGSLKRHSPIHFSSPALVCTALRYAVQKKTEGFIQDAFLPLLFEESANSSFTTALKWMTQI